MAANDPLQPFGLVAELGQDLPLLGRLESLLRLREFNRMPRIISKILLLLMDVVGVSRLTTHVIAFTYWPKDQRAVYWASDIKFVMVTKEPYDWRDFYQIQVFESNGDKREYLVQPSVLQMLENEYVKVEKSPRLETPQPD